MHTERIPAPPYPDKWILAVDCRAKQTTTANVLEQQGAKPGALASELKND
jgi:hypothetical protein